MPCSAVPAVVAAVLMTLAAPPANAVRRPMVEQDLHHFVWIADPQISPDGARVAFVRVTTDSTADDYRTSIWVVETAGGAPRPLTAGQRDGQPRWAPDGRTLAFVRAADDKPGQIHLLPMSGGEATPLTRLKGGPRRRRGRPTAAASRSRAAPIP